MAKISEKTRTFEMDLDLAQSPETVWRALTDAEELTRWFPLEARVNPVKGGSWWLSWNDRWKFDWKIELWEPGKHLRLTEDREESVQLVIDFQLAEQADGTRLRVVHSGFGQGADWDNEYEDISRGWYYELRSLRHYLTRHPGKKRHMVMLVQPTDLDARTCASLMMGPSALVAQGNAADVPEGQPYKMRSVFGENLDGRVLVNQKPSPFAGVVTSLDDGLLRFEHCEQTVMLVLAVWGDRADDVAAFQKRWQPKLQQLFG